MSQQQNNTTTNSNNSPYAAFASNTPRNNNPNNFRKKHKFFLKVSNENNSSSTSSSNQASSSSDDQNNSLENNQQQLIDGFKCCTYNIHVFKSGNGQTTLDKLIDYLTVGQIGSKPFDIIGLNEAFESKYRRGQILTPLNEIQKSLTKYYGTEYKCYYAPTCKTMGNCFITALPVKKTQTWRLAKGPGGVRNVLGLQLDLEKCKSPVEYFFLTHLDFINEEWRVKQFSQILEFMEKFMRQSFNTKDNNFVMMGDFNAMYKNDYTQEFWDQIQMDRMQEQWEPAVSTLMDILLGDIKDERLPIQKNLKCEKLYDTWRMCNKELQFNGRNLSSSRLKTRIDYILCSKSLSKNVLHSCIDTKSKTTSISDHNPVITHFSFLA
ncbi:endonuclease/exonuclease/phosphatase family protein [Naegleria gruberi]|uniref:Endonuclease/exonuclease/phosphatase family protein n=1 Tax=Naegleria gruberi TaxID=5762 RepID=D2VBV1_NAEGR|nr:endonuclease/exonuclease/phosphatase family protein [Naegleria gruberi]EFC45535.1 endonuclease/exonuclease/phosphatase family protein [Naegleria gruberi]|eukprot:XP_002678279.1 endonuclease/exonuclease/phosphatase family protein [Naegleria gruberi strain NEG-M]